MSKRTEYLKLAIYLAGVADALATINPAFSEQLKDASDKLDDAGKHICAQGYFGCHSGERCTSDHK